MCLFYDYIHIPIYNIKLITCVAEAEEEITVRGQYWSNNSILLASCMLYNSMVYIS